jgi:hypothetical protein
MKLPSLQEMKRLGYRALKQSWEPSALERGIQYLREGAFDGLDIARRGSSGQRIEFTLKDPSHVHGKSIIDFESPAQPTYSHCDCSHAGHGIFCKHQAASTLILTLCLTEKDDTARLPEPVWAKVDEFRGLIESLRTQKSATMVSTSHVAAPDLKALVILETLIHAVPSNQPLTVKVPKESDYEKNPVLPFIRSNEIFAPQSLFFLYADDTLVPANKVLFHAYSKSIPHELIPTQVNLKQWWDSFTRYFRHGKLELFYGRIPHAAATMHSAATLGDEALQVIPVKTIQDTEDSNWEPGLEINLTDTAAVRIQVTQAPNNWIMGDSFALNVHDHSLMLHQMNILRSILPTEKLFNQPKDFHQWLQVIAVATTQHL